MRIFLHDASRLTDLTYDAAFKPICGTEGFSHCATIEVEHEYQVEEWIHIVEKDHPEVVRIHCRDLRREWRRWDGTRHFVEVEFSDTVLPGGGE